MMKVKDLIEYLKIFHPDNIVVLKQDQYSNPNGKKLKIQPSESAKEVIEIVGYIDPLVLMDEKTAIYTVTEFFKLTQGQDTISLPKSFRIARDVLGCEVVTKIYEEENSK